jgi:hypothetical protein
MSAKKRWNLLVGVQGPASDTALAAADSLARNLLLLLYLSDMPSRPDKPGDLSCSITTS